MIVVDTNVIAYLYLPGPHTAAAEGLLLREPLWCAAGDDGRAITESICAHGGGAGCVKKRAKAAA